MKKFVKFEFSIYADSGGVSTYGSPRGTGPSSLCMYIPDIRCSPFKAIHQKCCWSAIDCTSPLVFWKSVLRQLSTFVNQLLRFACTVNWKIPTPTQRGKVSGRLPRRSGVVCPLVSIPGDSSIHIQAFVFCRRKIATAVAQRSNKAPVVRSAVNNANSR